MTGHKPLLEMRGIRKEFPGVVALDAVDFELWSGEVHVLLGENGAGKSTLMKILSGAYDRDRGEIRLDGEPVEIASPRQALLLGIRTIYQEFNLVPSLSVAENIFLGREPSSVLGLVDLGEMARRAQDVLQDLGVELDVRSPVSELSVAEQQMVEVAKALSGDARVLIMDEPTSALTESEIRQLFLTMGRLKSRGVGIVYISHRLDEITQIGDRVTILRDGKFVRTLRVSDAEISELVRLMADRDLKEHFPKRSFSPGRSLLEVRGLTRHGAFSNISFVLRAGEVVGLAGLMGSGRTALAHSLFGVQPFDKGEIWVGGRPAKISSPAAAIRHGMGYLTEDRKREGLVLSLSLQSNISLPNMDRVSRAGVLDTRAEQDLAGRCVRELRIKTSGLQQRALFLSGGNQQKVVLSKWLVRNADILIFDEPTRGIDVGAKVEIYELMNDLTSRGAGLLMISSELPEVLGMSDRILVMRGGRLVAEFHRSEASQEKVLGAALGFPEQAERNRAC